jgi:hypothetical protein
MYHTIRFTTDQWVDLERSPRQPLERLLLRAGTPILAQIKPHVVEGVEGPVEVADLFFEDGTATRGVPFARFAFVD